MVYNSPVPTTWHIQINVLRNRFWLRRYLIILLWVTVVMFGLFSLPSTLEASILQNLLAVAVVDVILIVLLVLFAVVTRPMYETTFAMDRNGVARQTGSGGQRTAEARARSRVVHV